MKSIKVKILGPVAVLAVLVLVTSAFSILGAGNIEKRGVLFLTSIWRQYRMYLQCRKYTDTDAFIV